MRYYKTEVAQRIGIRADQFKKNVQRRLYDPIVGPPQQDERGHRFWSEDQLQKLIEWYAHSAKPLRILSMGGGVQTTAMLLMHLHGEWNPAPDCTIFIDLGAESLDTYRNLRWLQGLAAEAGHPFHWVDAPKIADDLLAAADDRSLNVRTPPLHIRKPDGGKGQINRDCTGSYKVETMARYVRTLFNLAPRQLNRHNVDVWLGITTDEAHRLNNNSRYPWMTNVFPLADKNLSRDDCTAWLVSHGYPVPPKSACVFCPYRPNADWLAMKQHQPQDWSRAVQIDGAIRGGLSTLDGQLYLHQSLKPLDQVEFDRSKKSGWGNECSGLCAT